MSYCKRDGKDKHVFVTKEDATDPSKISTLAEDESFGLIASDGSINWDCPCLGGMAQGPCGVEFKSAFSCFHYSTEEMKGSDCLPQFKQMQECFHNYPEVYGKFNEEEEEEEGEEGEGKGENGDKKESEIYMSEDENNDTATISIDAQRISETN